MSRTYRRTNRHEFDVHDDPLWVREWGDYYYWMPFYRVLDPRSAEGRKALARFQSDRGHGYRNHRGPMWFHRLYSQRPYRREAERDIVRWVRDPDHEIILVSKPRHIYVD